MKKISEINKKVYSIFQLLGIYFHSNPAHFTFLNQSSSKVQNNFSSFM